MSNIKIETLTPVHIGSGSLLYHNSDFITEQIDGEKYLVVISENKIGKLLGDKSSQFIDLWLQTIAIKGDIKQFISTFAPNAEVDDYAKRKILSFSNINPNDTLKECIHNGLGLPYIPGSSIKGAIRTVVLASLASKVSDKETKIQVQDRKGRTKIEATNIEKELFGNDPNSDVFRFIQVGDAYFEKETEIATRLINLNIRKNDSSLLDTLKSQLVEAIGTDTESEFHLKVSNEYYDFVKKNYRQTGNLPVASVNDLFSLINEHTRKLVKDEIDYWQGIDKTGGNDYVDEMKKILQEINGCNPGQSCVLRIGHASGWRFITGAWTEELDNFKNTVIPASRPGNRNYEAYDFPKTRRIDEDSYILGFVKLTI